VISFRLAVAIFLDLLQKKKRPILLSIIQQKGYVEICQVKVKVMVFNTTFNNISVISWWLVLLVEETGVPEEKKD
jgi:hypothetical protein